MNRDEIYKDIEEMFGFVPSFMKVIPDSSLELEWKLMKGKQFDKEVNRTVDYIRSKQGVEKERATIHATAVQRSNQRFYDRTTFMVLINKKDLT